jgi:hypothetical protein
MSAMAGIGGLLFQHYKGNRGFYFSSGSKEIRQVVSARVLRSV